MPAFLQYEFMVRALIGAALVGVIAPTLGTFLVLRRLSLIADTLSHVAFMGVAIGLALRAAPAAVALGTAAIGAAAIEELRARRRLPGDVALAIVLYAALAIAVVVIGLSNGFGMDIFGFLFGSVLTTRAADVWMLAGLAAVCLLFVTAFFTELAQEAFDDDLARVSGVPVRWVNLALAVLTGATITLSMRVVGVLLVGALIVVPVQTALRLATGLRATLAIAITTGVVSSVAGTIAAFYVNVAAGGAIVFTSIGLLLAAEATSALRRARQRPAVAEPATRHSHEGPG
ncbi:MAG: metal ABC transporter permease [SAR202 cluster bacterium]|nr:metal ABC transporter permease [SAR202 cluster bacterium]